VQHSGPPRRSRNLEERLLVRFPAAWRALAALVLRLFSPRSRLRRAMLRRAVVSGSDAFSRLDLELVLVRYAPNVEYEFDPQFEALGIGGTFRGHEGMLELIEAFGEAWGQREVRPMLILDLDDRALILGTLRLPGTASGLEFESEYAQLLTPRGGRVAHEQDFLAWDRGLGAAGLEPQAFALPSRVKPGQAASSAG
jgi:ketosteroid isomerase-like protein